MNNNPSKLNGLVIVWHRNGIMAEEGCFRNGHRHGRWKWWTSKGVCIKDAHFVDGLPHGRVTDYDTRGNILSEAYYINGIEISSGPLLRDVG